jgi:UDP-N-acetylglucosamine--N-acetylmuramyl-(pentapeptide) pyrophosphoryl-undecaprenol N-acetylglucosamine transferase
MAGVMGIPLAIQEQNAYPGVTTRLLARWSRQIHLAFPEARPYLPGRAGNRARVSGNPVRELEPADPSHARAHFGLDPASRVVLVVGGSQGAEAINRAVLEMVEGLETGRWQRPEDLEILWSTGPAHLAAVEARLEELGNPDWVRASGYITEVSKALVAATLAVGRAGAMTTAEFLAWGLPSLLVPLPTAAENHQTRNAESLAEAGSALHLPEAGLTPETLWESLSGLLADPDRLEEMKRAAMARGRPQATREIARALADLLPSLPPGIRIVAPAPGPGEGEGRP